MLKLFALIVTGLMLGGAATESIPLTLVEMPAAAPFATGTVVESQPFGDRVGGRPLWLSANGRFAAMFRLTDDTDKNGKLEINFGMHGDSWGDDLMLDVFDLERGTHQRFDDLLSQDGSGRYAVLRRGSDTLLFDAADGSARNLRELGGRASADANACMSPRQIAFDAHGENIALLRDDPSELVVFSPATGTHRVIYRSTKPLWRVWFTSDPGWFLAAEVKGKFPSQRTSCVSSSRTVFAVSYSMSGFDAADTTYVLIDPQGTRYPLGESPGLVSGGIHSRPKAGTLHRADGDPVALPEGCKLAGGAEGARVVVLGCGASMQLFDPASGERRALPPGESLEFIEGSRTTGTDGTWYGVKLPIAGASDSSSARFRLGRLRLEDLRLERGPAVFFSTFTAHPAWLVGGKGDDYYALNVASGTLLTAHAKDTEARFDTLALRVGSPAFLLLDPDRGLAARAHREVGIGNGHGCFMAPVGAKNVKVPEDLEPGPWIRMCVARAQ